ncbi:hypothetical protein HBH98_087730 [Parastagonospora nodorum]|nr:hypothetical protein HBI10_114510 [Parastagonospora nodorum]KAH4013163.1 hypothetical protein HBI13_180560 [Parastagonospora nodorum]KAH4035231.1 hypothetical protein HBI09_096960 [Parastagonospora nodorum]KAH4347945.1 hypothetical protein HBH98_087730 [Parastagonospora nodorum]KAH4377368.1 hypothetical protein HBH97_108210 [Parastagonospora nodorum]
MRSTLLLLAVSCLSVFTSAQKISKTGRCGAQSGLTCQGSSFGNCCSQYNYCGSNPAYCSTGCQPKFGTCKALPASAPSAASKPKSKVSTDGTCGGRNGFTCSGSRFGSCCSQHGYCGKSSAYCGVGCNQKFGTCSNAGASSSTPSSSSTTCSTLATSTRSSSATASPASSLKVSSNGRCGNAYKANPAGMTCQGSVYGDCCSQYSYCGSTSAYCGGGCQGGFGKCNIGSSSSGPLTISSASMTAHSQVSSVGPSVSSSASQSMDFSSSSLVTPEVLETSSSIMLSSSSTSTAEPITSSITITSSSTTDTPTVVSSSTIDIITSSAIVPASETASSSSGSSPASSMSLSSSSEATTSSSMVTSVVSSSEVPTPTLHPSSVETASNAAETPTLTPEVSSPVETPTPSSSTSTVEPTSIVEPTSSAPASPKPTPEPSTSVEPSPASSTSSCIPTPTNYLANGNFESGSVQPFVFGSSAPGTTNQINAAAAHSGNFGFHVQQVSRVSITNAIWQFAQQNVKIPSGTTVSCSSWVNALRTPVVQVLTYIYIDNTLCHFEAVTKNDWTKPTGSVTVSGDTHTVLYRVILPVNNFNYVGPLFDVDEISITPMTGPDAVASC